MQAGSCKRNLLFMLVAWSTASVIGAAQTNSGTQQPPQVEVEMRNILYHFTDHVAVHIFSLQGKLVPAKQNGIPVFDDNRSFILAIRSAEIAISASALANVLNQHVFASPDAPIKNIALAIDGNMLKITGRLHSKGDIPFEAEGTLSLTAQGEILIHTQKIKAAHLPVKGLMDLLGLEVSDLINTQKVRGVRAEKDDLVLSPEQILPPPQIQGRVTGVKLKGDEIIQTFGGVTEGKGLQQQSGNYMAYRGAQLRFGKLTMSDTDMVLIDMDPQDPFDFYLDHYKEQLVAGYTKITPEFGLRVYMRDFDKLQNRKRSKQK